MPARRTNKRHLTPAPVPKNASRNLPAARLVVLREEGLKGKTEDPCHLTLHQRLDLSARQLRALGVHNPRASPLAFSNKRRHRVRHQKHRARRQQRSIHCLLRRHGRLATATMRRAVSRLSGVGLPFLERHIC